MFHYIILLLLQVFGGLLTQQPGESVDETDSVSPEEGEKEEEVREQMVDIFFGKSKLSGLQKQVGCPDKCPAITADREMVFAWVHRVTDGAHVCGPTVSLTVHVCVGPPCH